MKRNLAYIRRCLIDDSRHIGKFHAWDVRTGKPVRFPTPAEQNACAVASFWSQNCPRHGGPNTVKEALESGVPPEYAVLCKAKAANRGR